VRQYPRERAGAQRLREDASINTSRQIDVTLFMDISTHLKHLCISIACQKRSRDLYEQLIHTAVAITPLSCGSIQSVVSTVKTHDSF
jgi:hypothetical protein